MSFEEQPKGPHLVEEGPEHIPTAEEVRSVFEQLTGGAKWEEVRAREDEKGLWLWEIRLPDGTEYSYMRKGRHAPQLEASRTAIYMTEFDGDMPAGGHNVAEFENGAWKMLS